MSSSPNVNLQSLIRKFKNNSKEDTDKKKIISNYTHSISLDKELDGEFLFQSKNRDNFKYDLSCFQTEKKFQYSSVSSPILILSSLSRDAERGIDFDNLYSVYNTEFCDDEWLIMIHFINTVYYNFLKDDQIVIKSLHINNSLGPCLSSLHHFLYNSETAIKNMDWKWISTVPDVVNIKVQNLYKLRNRYKSRFLVLLSSINNNTNFIINETTRILTKSNLLIINEKYDYLKSILYATYIIKILDSSGIFFMRLPNTETWDTKFIGILLLYTLLFTEVYIYKYDLSSNYLYLLCKNKKKINSESMYKKILFISGIFSNDSKNSDNLSNLFSNEIFELPEIRQWLLDITNIVKNINQNTYKKNIIFEDIFEILDKTLKINTNTLL